MWKLVRKYPANNRPKSIQSKINKLGKELNKMDDWHMKEKGYYFRMKKPKTIKILVFR